MPLCFICNEHFEIPPHLIVQLNIFHDIGNIKKFLCKELNCLREFSSLNSFKKHISSHTFITNIVDLNNSTTLKMTISCCQVKLKLIRLLIVLI